MRAIPLRCSSVSPPMRFLPPVIPVSRRNPERSLEVLFRPPKSILTPSGSSYKPKCTPGTRLRLAGPWFQNFASWRWPLQRASWFPLGKTFQRAAGAGLHLAPLPATKMTNEAQVRAVCCQQIGSDMLLGAEAGDLKVPESAVGLCDRFGRAIVYMAPASMPTTTSPGFNGISLTPRLQAV
jgi:hypothetical protein